MKITEFEINAQIIWSTKKDRYRPIEITADLKVGKITKIEKSKRNIWVTGENGEALSLHAIKPSWILAIEDMRGEKVDFGAIVGIAKITPQGKKFLKTLRENEKK